MATPFLGEMRIFSFNFAPKGWATCAGQLLPINQNQALFSLLGTMYGGDGRTTFALPDFRGRTMVHVGADSPTQGLAYGEYNHTLTLQEMPQHVHQALANGTQPSSNSPGPTLRLSSTSSGDLYGPATSLAPMAAGMLANAGGSQPHNNTMPSSVTRICIALQGIFPSRN